MKILCNFFPSVKSRWKIIFREREGLFLSVFWNNDPLLAPNEDRNLRLTSTFARKFLQLNRMNVDRWEKGEKKKRKNSKSNPVSLETRCFRDDFSGSAHSVYGARQERDNFWSREETIHVEIFGGISLRQQRSQKGIRDEMVTTSSSKLVPFKINGKMLIANFPRTRSTYSTTLESRRV